MDYKKHSTIVFLIIFCILSFTLCGCKKKIEKFNNKNISNAFLIIMNPSGQNETRHFFSLGIKNISRLLNLRKREHLSDDTVPIGDYGKYFLRFNYNGKFYTIKFRNASDFTIENHDKIEKFHVNSFLNFLLNLDFHSHFDTAEISDIRKFSNDMLLAPVHIPVSKIVELMDILARAKDKFVSKSVFDMNPEFILRIQLNNGGYQLYCGEDSVWLFGKDGFYVYKSVKIKKILKKIKEI